MKHVLPLGLIAIATSAVLVGGCSGSGGGGILNNPTGAITLSDATTGQAITTNSNNPFMVSDLRFSIDVFEPHFAGPYQTSIVFQQNRATAANGGVPYVFSFNQPCYAITQKANLTNQTVTLTFSGDNANGQSGVNPPATPVPTPAPSGATPAPTASPFTGNPCHSGEFEQLLIDDGHGHILNFYYEET